MLNLNGNLKRIISMVLSLAMIMSLVPMTAFAEGSAIYLMEDEISEEILSGGEFYLATSNAKIEESSVVPYLFKIGRGGEDLPEAEVRLNIIDITAKYGEDYTIRIHNGSIFDEKVTNTDSNTSLIELIVENEDAVIEDNYSDGIVSGESLDADQAGEMYQEDIELLDDFLAEEVEGYVPEEEPVEESVVEQNEEVAELQDEPLTQETEENESMAEEETEVEEIEAEEAEAEETEVEETEAEETEAEEAETEETETEETEAEESEAEAVEFEEDKSESSEEATVVPGEEATVSVNSLKAAKEIATGLKSDKTPMDGGNNSLDLYAQEILSELSMELESAYLIVKFDENEAEKYIEIIPEDNNNGDGDRLFSVSLFSASETAVISEKSGMTVSIIDDEIQEPASVSFTESEYFPEHGFIQATLERTGAINQVVSVTVTTEDVTAVKGRDYSQVETAVVFPYGITQRTINIPIRSEYLEQDAEFKIIISDAASCNVGEIDTAYGIISSQSESYSLFAESDDDADAVLHADATVSSYFTGDAIDLPGTAYSTGVANDGYSRASGNEWHLSPQNTTYDADYAWAHWSYGNHYDYSGIAIDWTKESGKPCYTDTYVEVYNGSSWPTLWSSDSERWERRTNNVYFPFDLSSCFYVELTREGSFLGKSPTLKVHSIKPILRPFEITLVGAEPIYFLNENNVYVKNTEMQEVSDANKTLLQNASNTGTGTVVKFSGDSFTVTSNSKFSYIKGLKIVNNVSGESKIIKDNLAVGTTSVSVKLTNAFLKENFDYITFSDNGSYGRKGAFSVQAVMGHYDTTVKIYKDYRGEVSYNEAEDGLKSGYYFIKNVNSGLYLGQKSETAGNLVQRSTKDNASIWYVSGETRYVFENYASDKSMKFPYNDGNPVYTNGFSFYTSHTLKKQSDGSFVIRNFNDVLDIKYSSLSENAPAIAIEAEDGEYTDSQKWIFEDANIVTTGTYRIKNVKSGLYIRPDGGASSAVKQSNDLANLNWYVTQLDDGWYSLQSENGYMLDVKSASSKNWASLITYASNGTDAQRFKLQRLSDGTYNILTKVTSGASALDVASGSTASGASVIQYKLGSGDNFKWIFEDVSTFASIEDSAGITLKYHKGDKIRFTQTVYDEYSSSYTGSRIRIVTKDNSTASSVDNKRAYDTDTNYCTILNTYSNIDVYPNFDKKNNHIIVRVAKTDLSKFNTSSGIFKSPSSEAGKYMEYTVVDKDEFAAGVYYEFTATAAEDGYTPVWKQINKSTKYSQGTFYFESTDEIEENIIYLTCQKADSQKYVLTGNAYYSDVALNGGQEATAWMPASGVYVMMGSANYGVSNEEGNFNTVGMYGINGMSVIYKTVASGITEYNTAVLSNGKTSDFGSGVQIKAYDVNIGTVKASAIDHSAPYVSAVVAANVENVESGVIYINDNITMFTVTLNNNGALYTDTDGVERTEKVTAVDFLVYDKETHTLKFTVSGAKEIQSSNGMSIWTLSSTFTKGDSAKYAASDELFVRITTDKVVGNGKGFNSDGTEEELEALKQTVYAPINTGYTFVESNRQEPVTQDIKFDTNMNFIELPLIGSMEATFNIKSVSLSISALPNGGQRLAIGYIAKTDQEKESEELADNGVNYGVKDIKKAFGDIKEFGEGAKDKSSLAMKSWGLQPIFGVYLDFGLKNVYYTEETSQKLVFIGGGLYVGITGKFRLVQYFVIGWVPFYLGVDGQLDLFNQTGVRALNEDTATSDSILTEQNSLEENFVFSTCLQANGQVSAYVGAGLCGTIGVRGGINFAANYIYNPTINYAYPDYHKNGLILTANIKVWIDAVLFSIPVPVVSLMDEKYGYFKDVASSESASLMSLQQDGGSEVIMKPRSSGGSEWMPEVGDASLMSSFEEDTSTVLLENGYDRADSQLLDLGDGRIMLAFLADDAERTDDNRTALMYSIYSDGTWSEPVKVQDDGTADFEPDICDANDKVLISWTSREAGLEYTTETEYLKSLDVYTTTLDKATLELGEIERLTDDEFYDSAPMGVYDSVSGDMLVYYLKSEVGSDFKTSVSPTANESVIVYMLYDAKQGKWARDYYYDNEVESEEAEEILVNQWGGQRFLSSPIKDFEMNDPIIIDFDAVSYNGIGVYTYTVDKDNNMDTDADRELFVQAYDFETHSTYVPVRITNDNVSDARPQLARNGEYTYLFWLQNNADIRYINVSDLIKNGVSDNGDIKDDYELNCGVVFFVNSEGSDVNPTFGSYKAFVDKDNNLFVTWLQPVLNEDGSSNQEVFATAFIRDEEGSSWSDGVRLTHSGLFNDEVAFVTDSNGDLLTVGNQYSMDLTDDAYEVSDVKLVATKFKTVGSLEVEEVKYSNDTPQAGSTVEVDVKIKNTGLKPAGGYSLTVCEKINGEIKEEVFSVTSENGILPSSSEIVTFEWTMPESYDDVEEQALYIQVQEKDMDEIESYSSESIKIQPVYNITECAVEEKSDGFYITYSVENVGNADAVCDDLTTDDKVVVKFNDIYYSGKKVESYLEAPIGGLEINEVKTCVMPLEIADEQFEFGYTNAYIEVQDKDGESLSNCETFMITLEHPYNVIVNGDEELSKITLDEDESIELSAEYSPSEFYADANINYHIEDTSVAYMKDGKLVANNAGETQLTVMVVPYGGCKTLTVEVKEKKASSNVPSGSGGTTRYTITFNTDGGSEIDSVTVNRNSVIGEIETPVKEGYVFEGWYLDEKLTEKADLGAKVTSAMTLYAKWIEEPKTDEQQSEWNNPFEDVKSEDWFYENVRYVNQNGLFSGITETTFAPAADLTRAMLVTVLYRAEGKPEVEIASKFADVADDSYYADAVAWAQANGIVNGISEDEFAPDVKITREQIAAIMYRYAVYKGVEAVTLEENLGFADADDISEYAVSAMNWVVGHEIIKGYEDATVRPLNNATRAEAAAVLQRFLEKLEVLTTAKE